MSANAIETLLEWLPHLGGTSVPATPIKPKQSREIHEAVAAVEELLEAAKALVAIEAEEDIMGTRWFAREAAAQANLAAAVRRVEEQA